MSSSCRVSTMAKCAAFRHWHLEGTVRHHKGISLVLRYKKTTGVMVDIIPVKPQKELLAKHAITESFRQLFDKYCKEPQLTTYYTISDGKFPDTGIIENQVLKALPQDLKIPLRMAKYVLQTHLALPKLCAGFGSGHFRQGQYICTDHIHVTTETITLYGYVPLLRSYVIKFLFLHLVSSAVGTEYEAKLTVPALTMCLLDMVMHIVGTNTRIADVSKSDNPRYGSHYSRVNTQNPNSPTVFNVVTKNPFELKMLTDPDGINSGRYFLNAVGPAMAVLSCEFFQSAHKGGNITADDVPLINKPNPFLQMTEKARPRNNFDTTQYVEETNHLVGTLHDNFIELKPAVYGLQLFGFCRGASAERILACSITHEQPEGSRNSVSAQRDSCEQSESSWNLVCEQPESSRDSISVFYSVFNRIMSCFCCCHWAVMIPMQ